MRLFVAVEIGELLSRKVAEVSRELQRRAADAAPHAKVTWVPPDRMHLTIRFIGEVDDGKAALVLEAFEPPLPVPSFGLTLCGVGTFPRGGTPRVVWIGVTEGREALLAIERAVTARLASLGIPEEDRAFSPHLTLARVREPGRLKAARLVDGLTECTIGSVRVDAITLFHSKLSPKGPTYTPLLRSVLGGPEDPPRQRGVGPV